MQNCMEVEERITLYLDSQTHSIAEKNSPDLAALIGSISSHIRAPETRVKREIFSEPDYSNVCVKMEELSEEEMEELEENVLVKEEVDLKPEIMPYERYLTRFGGSCFRFSVTKLEEKLKSGEFFSEIK